MLTAHIVFATITGNSEEIADILADRLAVRGVAVQETEISQTDAYEFIQSDLLIASIYTYDQGKLPEESLDFCADLQTLKLTNKIYGVTGSGDKYYGQYYNIAVDQFSELFEKLGAQAGTARLKIELEPDEQDIEDLDRFAHNLVWTANNRQK